MLLGGNTDEVPNTGGGGGAGDAQLKGLVPVFGDNPNPKPIGLGGLLSGEDKSIC